MDSPSVSKKMKNRSISISITKPPKVEKTPSTKKLQEFEKAKKKVSGFSSETNIKLSEYRTEKSFKIKKTKTSSHDLYKDQKSYKKKLKNYK